MLVCADIDVPKRGHDDSAAAALHTIPHSGKPSNPLPRSLYSCDSNVLSQMFFSLRESLMAWHIRV